MIKTTVQKAKRETISRKSKVKTSRQEKTKSLNLIIKGNSPKMKTECRSNDTTRNHNSLSVMFCLRSAFVYAHVHSAHHVELPQPHPKRIHQKPPLTLQHFVTALSQAAIFVSFPHLLPYQPAKQQRFAELQPSGFLHRTAGRCHGPSPSPRLPRLCARLAQNRRAKTRSERRGKLSACPQCHPYVLRSARRLARREGEDFRGMPAGRPEPPQAIAERVKHEEDPAPVLGQHPAQRPELLPPHSPRYRAGAEVRLGSSASSFLSSFCAAFGAMPPLGGTAERSTPCPTPAPKAVRPRPGRYPPPGPSPPLCPRPPAARPAPPAVSRHRLGAAPRLLCESPGPAARTPAPPPAYRAAPPSSCGAPGPAPPVPARPGRPCRPPSVRTEPSRDSPPTALPRHHGGGPAEARSGQLLPGHGAAAILAAGRCGPVAPGDAEVLAAVRGPGHGLAVAARTAPRAAPVPHGGFSERLRVLESSSCVLPAGPEQPAAGGGPAGAVPAAHSPGRLSRAVRLGYLGSARSPRLVSQFSMPACSSTHKC